MNLHPNDYNTLILCAFRYALGRSSYVTEEISDIIRDNLTVISIHILKIIVKEIDEATRKKEIAMRCDREIWLGLKRDINKHLKEVLKNEVE